MKRSLYQLTIVLIIGFLAGNTSQAQGFTCASGTKYKEYTAYSGELVSESGPDDPDRVPGYPDGAYAKIEQGENMVLEFDDFVMPGDSIFYWATSDHDDDNASVNIAISADGSTWSSNTAVTIPGNNKVITKRNYIVPGAVNIKYIRFSGRAADAKLRIDAVGYNKWACGQLCSGTTFTYISGTSTAVVASNSVGGTNNSIGLPDGDLSELDNTSDFLVLQLAQTIPAGSVIQLYLGHEKDTEPVVTFRVTASDFNGGFNGTQDFVTHQEKDGYSQFAYEVTDPDGVRFVRFTLTGNPQQKAYIAGLRYDYPTFKNGRSNIVGNVFNDVNTNGVLDGGETGASGITVQLYQDANNNNSVDPADILLQTIATGANGLYNFKVSNIGINYIVNIAQNTLPANTTMSTDNEETASFTGLNQFDCNNDFGYYFCGATCPPTALNDFSFFTVNTPQTVQVLTNDLGNYDPAAVTVGGALLQPANGKVVVNPDGTIVYSPDFGFTGIDSFQYQVCARHDPAICDIATVVMNSCQATTAQNIIGGIVFMEMLPDNSAYDEGEVATAGITVELFSDANCNGIVDGADAVLATATTDANGYYAFTEVAGCYSVALDLSPSGGNYIASNVNTASTSFAGTGSCDNTLHLGLRANVDAINDTRDIVINNAGIIPILNNDIGVLDVTTVDTTGLLQPANGTITINANGTITYIPDWNYIGPDIFQYQVCSADDPAVCDVASVSVSVECPVINGQNTIYGSIYEDINVSSTYDEGEYWTLPEQLDVNLYTDANDNELLDAGDALIATVTTDAAGNFQFQVINLSGNYLVEIDTANAPAASILTTASYYPVTFIGGNNAECGNDFGFAYCAGTCAPVARDDARTMSQGTALFLDVMANDFDLNGDLDRSSVSIIQSPVNGNILIQDDYSMIFIPNGNFIGTETFVYTVCDMTNPLPLCDTATATITIVEGINDPCAEATREHTFYMPYPEQHLRTSLINAASTSCASYHTNVCRSVTTITSPYPGVIMTWDHWEDGYESDIKNPVQTTTLVWGDGDTDNGTAPGYPDDIVPPGAQIVLDNNMIYNPRDPSFIAFDGMDKLYTTGDVAIAKIAGDNNVFAVQAAKSDVYDVVRFGTSFTVQFGEDLGNEFQYSSLFIRASEDVTDVSVDLDNDGTVDTVSTLNEGEVLFIDGGVQSGARVTATKPVGVDALFGGLDCFGTRQISILPAAFYSDVYYTPVPTTAAGAPAAVYLNNGLDIPLSVNYTSTNTSGSIALNARSTVRFQLNDDSGYRFENPTGQSFTAMQVIDSDAGGSAYDWAFNLISESRLTDYASVAWAPGSIDGSGNYNPVWVTPTDNTTLYVKYDGNLTDTSGLESPCGIRYDVAIVLNELEYTRIFDNSDNDQSGLAVYTCDGTKISAVYGEDPSAGNPTPAASPALDVGTSIQPMCKEVLILAQDDKAVCQPNDFVVIDIVDNDFGFLVTLDLTSISTTGLLQPSNGSVTINGDGTVTYTPDLNWFGIDTFEYSICSNEDANLCDIATVYVYITNCDADPDENLINGYVYLEQLPDNGAYDGEERKAGFLVHLIGDNNCNGSIDGSERIIETTVTDASGAYSFSTIKGKFASDDFDDPLTLDDGNDGSVEWRHEWQEIGASNGFGTAPVQVTTDTDGDRALIINGASSGASREVQFDDANSSQLEFSYRRQGLNDAGEELQVRFNGTTVFVIDDGNGVGTNSFYFQVSLAVPYAIINPNGNNTVEFVTNASTTADDYFHIDDVQVTFFTTEACYITQVDVSDKNGAYDRADLDQDTVTFYGLGSCENEQYLGVVALITANDDFSAGEVNIPQLVDILSDDIGAPDVATLVITQAPSNGSVSINPDGTVTYTPDPGYDGTDDFDYYVCSEEDPLVCDEATVDITISCSVVADSNAMSGAAFNDFNENGIFDAGESLIPNTTFFIYEDVNGNGSLNGIEGNTPLDTIYSADGRYTFNLDAPIIPSTPIARAVSLGVDDAFEKDDGSIDNGNSKLELKSDKVYIGMRFQNITIPKDATIDNAYITFTSSDDRNQVTDLLISIEDDDQPAAITETDFDLSSRWSNGHTVTWNNVEVWAKDNQYNTPDLSPLVQQLVERNDWNSGDNMFFLVQWLQGERKARSFDEDPSVAPVLNISYSVNNYPISYVVQMDVSTLPYGGRLTTDNEAARTFTFVTESNCTNNIGVARNVTSAIDDINATLQNIPVSGSVLRNDIDIEQNGYSFGAYLNQVSGTPISSDAQIEGEDLNGQTVDNAGVFSFNPLNGEYNFVPATDFSGDVTMRYTMCDGGNPVVCDTGKVVISVNNFPNPSDMITNDIEAINDYNTSYGNPVSGNLINNDGDPENDGVSLELFELDIYGNDNGSSVNGQFGNTVFISGTDEFGTYWDKAGSFRLEDDGSYVFIPFPGFVGSVHIDYRICDDLKEPFKACDDGRLIIEVLLDKTINANDAPYAGDDFMATIINTPVSGKWITNDRDDNGDNVRFNASNTQINPSNPTGSTVIGTYATQEGGNLVVYKNGTYEYTPATDFFGPDQFAYRICDVTAQALCDSATMYFLVAPVYYDYGDLPAQYPTAGNMIPIDFNDDGTPDMPVSIWFGQSVDAELATMEDNGSATGDNLDGFDDEDGLVLPSWQPGTWNNGTGAHHNTAEFGVIVNGTDPGMEVYFGLWIDWEFDGEFDDFYNGIGYTQDNAQRNNQDTLFFSVPLPNIPRSSQVGIRLRAFQSAPSASMFGGSMRAGEVEDYIWYVSSLLPVELSNFEVKAEGNDAYLSWTTASEINNDYFSVQRSTDGINWTEAGVVDGHGNSTEVHDYAFPDLDLSAGVYYYRLQQFDFDGSYEFSDVRSVEIEENHNDGSLNNRELHIYPVPVHTLGAVNIEGVLSDEISIVMISLNGSQTIAATVPKGQPFNLSAYNLNAGMYLMQVEDYGRIFSEKIMVVE